MTQPSSNILLLWRHLFIFDALRPVVLISQMSPQQQGQKSVTSTQTRHLGHTFTLPIPRDFCLAVEERTKQGRGGEVCNLQDVHDALI
jgi:hypothetical protein